MPLSAAVPIAVTLAVMLGLANVLGPVLFPYRMDDKGLVFARFRLFRTMVPWDDIIEVETATLADVFTDDSLAGFRGRWWNNRPAWRYLVLRCRGGTPYILSPWNPAAFTENLLRRLRAAQRCVELGPELMARLPTPVRELAQAQMSKSRKDGLGAAEW